ncbi:uncharacterized protein LOC134675330 [Cydia fagiglandana]|uniref:uncharacterized protein LOC134675330 n=1 Tax=Cydia fagiglandana TaxID=1458189 RepID=UPI002FEE64EA
MKCMDQLPSVTTCCFCCFLRAGCVMIAVISFTAGVILAPNVSYTYTQSQLLLPEPVTNTEGIAQVLLGLVSILLCACSFLLFVGSFCNVPILIEIYLWGELIYGTSTTIIYIILACFCFLVHSNSATAGAWLILLIFVNFFLTCYFLIVANSLRMSLLFLHSTEVIY